MLHAAGGRVWTSSSRRASHRPGPGGRCYPARSTAAQIIATNLRGNGAARHENERADTNIDYITLARAACPVITQLQPLALAGGGKSVPGGEGQVLWLEAVVDGGGEGDDVRGEVAVGAGGRDGNDCEGRVGREEQLRLRDTELARLDVVDLPGPSRRSDEYGPIGGQTNRLRCTACQSGGQVGRHPSGWPPCQTDGQSRSLSTSRDRAPPSPLAARHGRPRPARMCRPACSGGRRWRPRGGRGG